MRFIEIKSLELRHKTDVLELWNKEYPETLEHKSLSDFEHYLSSLSECTHTLLIDDTELIQGWYFDFTREGEKWFALLINSSMQGKGFGTQLLNKAKAKETALNGWVIDHDRDKKKNGSTYKSPLGFYLKNGFYLLEQNRLEEEKISAVKVRWHQDIHSN